LVDFEKLFTQDPFYPDRLIFSRFHPKNSPHAATYDNEPFATQPYEIKAEWAFVTKGWVASIGLFYQSVSENKECIAQHINRRTVMETVWDTILYYISTRKKLLADDYYRSDSKFGKNPADIGDFDNYGLHIKASDSDYHHSGRYSHLNPKVTYQRTFKP
jgi:hypothetical protein